MGEGARRCRMQVVPSCALDGGAPVQSCKGDWDGTVTSSPILQLELARMPHRADPFQAIANPCFTCVFTGFPSVQDPPADSFGETAAYSAPQVLRCAVPYGP